jgi:Fes/CIP4, and EFC/F-BAR homology domain
MTVESCLIYIEESAKLCKELTAFYKKRQSFELEYAKDLGTSYSTKQSLPTKYKVSSHHRRETTRRISFAPTFSKRMSK